MAQNSNDLQSERAHVTPKLSMKLLYTLIHELKDENIQLNQRLTEYEMSMAALLQSNREAAAASISVRLPVEDAQQPLNENGPSHSLPALIDLPRSARHRTEKKNSIWIVFLHTLKKVLLPRGKRRGHFVR
ncbi:hypothetical protein ABE504_16035 [Paenibacillus oryzisoli]|uniref:hypothetical protein n=1 Tax=Paenibacillus oryzisoli TaxID=1850517 RepID=UPI003D29E86B